MSMHTTPSAEQRLYELGERLEQWRQTKTKRSDPIPEALWRQAITLTQTLPLRRVSKALGLSSYDLKRRLDRLEPPSQPSAPPINFIELASINGQAQPNNRAVCMNILDFLSRKLDTSGTAHHLSP